MLWKAEVVLEVGEAPAWTSLTAARKSAWNCLGSMPDCWRRLKKAERWEDWGEAAAEVLALWVSPSLSGSAPVGRALEELAEAPKGVPVCLRTEAMACSTIWLGSVVVAVGSVSPEAVLEPADWRAVETACWMALRVWESPPASAPVPPVWWWWPWWVLGVEVSALAGWALAALAVPLTFWKNWLSPELEEEIVDMGFLSFSGLSRAIKVSRVHSCTPVGSAIGGWGHDKRVKVRNFGVKPRLSPVGGSPIFVRGATQACRERWWSHLGYGACAGGMFSSRRFG